MSAEAGWFPDPSGRAGTFRWWDGSAWTRWLSAAATAPAPRSDPGTSLPAPPTVEAPAQDPARVRLPVAVGVVVGALVLALLAVGLTVTVTTRTVSSGPAMAPPPRIDHSGVRYDPGTRQASMQELSLRLPSQPYRCKDAPVDFEPVFTKLQFCEAMIHANYDGSNSWVAIVGLGQIPKDVVIPGDLKKTGEKVFARMRAQFYAHQKTTLKKYVSAPTTFGPADRVLALRGEVHYRVKGLRSTYSPIVLVVVRLQSGDYAAVFSDRSNDTPAKTMAALNGSLKTLTVK